MAVLNKFCFCWDVKKGSLIVAIGNLIITLIVILFTIAGLVGAYQEMNRVQGLTEVTKSQIIVLWVTLAATCIFFLLTILLICGIRKDRRGFILPWIIWTFIALTCSFIFICLTVDHLGGAMPIGIFLVRIFVLCLQIYFVLCIISHYQNLKEAAAGSSSNKV